MSDVVNVKALGSLKQGHWQAWSNLSHHWSWEFLRSPAHASKSSGKTFPQLEQVDEGVCRDSTPSLWGVFFFFFKLSGIMLSFGQKAKVARDSSGVKMLVLHVS